jgi:hypothetical protein
MTSGGVFVNQKVMGRRESKRLHEPRGHGLARARLDAAPSFHMKNHPAEDLFALVDRRNPRFEAGCQRKSDGDETVHPAEEIERRRLERRLAIGKTFRGRKKGPASIRRDATPRGPLAQG